MKNVVEELGTLSAWMESVSLKLFRLLKHVSDHAELLLLLKKENERLRKRIERLENERVDTKNST